MKIAVIGVGSGAHFLAQYFEDKVEHVYQYGTNSLIESTDKFTSIRPVGNTSEERKQHLLDTLDFFKSENVDLIIPSWMMHQIFPFFQEKIKEIDIPTLMPSSINGLLEYSKVYCKQVLKQLDIPTADYTVYSVDKLLEEFTSIKRPFVLKFDKDWREGLQTIIVTDSNYQSVLTDLNITGRKRNLSVLGDFVDQKFVVEEYIEGVREYSYHSLCNEHGYRFIGSSKDYKKLYDNDMGPNTAGMGCIGPVDTDSKIHGYVEKLLKHLKDKNTFYKGVLFLGIMIDKDNNPIVLEINTRFGDPELCSLIPNIDNITELLLATSKNEVIPEPQFNNKYGVSVRIVHKNYNLDDKLSLKPVFINIPEGITVNYITQSVNSHCVVSTVAESIEEGRTKLYNYLNTLNLGDYRYRTDIGLE